MYKRDLSILPMLYPFILVITVSLRFFIRCGKWSSYDTRYSAVQDPTPPSTVVWCVTSTPFSQHCMHPSMNSGFRPEVGSRRNKNNNNDWPTDRLTVWLAETLLEANRNQMQLTALDTSIQSSLGVVEFSNPKMLLHDPASFRRVIDSSPNCGTHPRRLFCFRLYILVESFHKYKYIRWDSIGGDTRFNGYITPQQATRSWQWIQIQRILCGNLLRLDTSSPSSQPSPAYVALRCVA